MVVDKRHRRVVGRPSKSVGISIPTSGSRFGVLLDNVENNNLSGGVVLRDMELERLYVLASGSERPKAVEYHVTPKNVTYLISNPDKKAKVPNKASSTAKVIPTIDGKDAIVVPHNVGIATVASCQFKGLKGNVRKGLGVRKPSVSRLPLVDRSLNVDVGFHEVRSKSRQVTAHSSHVVHVSDGEDSLFDAR
ncbi:hypothetical protein V6N13_076756 [Hibiscus sabdariffa]